MNLWQSLRGQRAVPISTVDDYLELVNGFQYGGLSYPLTGGTPGVTQTLAGGPTERIGSDFIGLAQQAYASNGVVFACMLVRQLVFSAVRFRWQRLVDGRPSDSFGSADLATLETPWIGGTTQDLLNRVIQDADLAGNYYGVTDTPLPRIGGDGGTELVRMRPDWIEIIAQERVKNGGRIGWRRAGYIYTDDGPQSGNEPVPLLLDEVAHFAPVPDPLATFRGMSWLTPIIREIQGDQLMTRHKRRFFENGATPNMVVRHSEGATEDKVRRWVEQFDEKYRGVDNAGKTMHLYPGADATVVGANFQEIDFKSVQGAGETRIAAAAGVPDVIVGLSEGLQGSSLNAGNYGQARRRLADITAHPLWQNVSGSLAVLLPLPGPGVRLWYDASGVPFLREDEKDAAEIAAMQAQTIRGLVDGGYKPDSVVAAVEAGDWRLLQHTGLFSVQLQPAGQKAALTTGGTDVGSAA